MAIYKFDEDKRKNNNADYQKIVGCVFVAISILNLFCLITHLVPFMKSFLLGVAGLFCYPFFITLLAIGFALIGHKKYVMPKKYAIFLSLSILFVLCVFQLLLVRNSGLNFGEYLAKCYTQKTTAGGILLGLVTGPVLYILNRLGAYIIFIALSLVMIALLVDYIHYLSKNQNLKKAIKVEQEQKEPIRNMTVGELEAKLNKERKINFFEYNNSKKEKEKEKVKLTLDAKIEEKVEQDPRVKLGLLASSKIDSDDNTKYFKEEQEPQKNTMDTREYILSGAKDFKLSEYSKNKLAQIQSNFNNLKSSENQTINSNTLRNQTSVGFNNLNNYSNSSNNSNLNLNNNSNNLNNPNYFNSYNKPNIILNNSLVNKTQNVELPNKVIHEEYTTFTSPFKQSDVKSFIGNQEESKDDNFGNVDILEENISPKYEIFDKVNEPIKFNENTEVNETFNSNDKLNNSSKLLDVDDFTNSVLSSLTLNQDKKEENSAPVNNSFNTQSNDVKVTNFYSTPSNLFQETKVEEVQSPVVNKNFVYVKPPIELLTTESMNLSLMNENVAMKREELEITLDTFGIPAKVIGVVIGPAVTRYELEMPAGVSVKRLTALSEDIAYSLESNGSIRMETPIPGRRAVGIEVPNETVATVGLRDVIMSPEFMNSKANLSIALGKDISDQIKTFSLVKVPHVLVAGTTGSGKSVCINSIILSLIYKYSPDELKFIMVDPKRVELSMYNNLPHLLIPNVITDSEKALNALAWCVDEMERRFITFSNARVKNLEEYNNSKDVLEGITPKIPYIIFIIDELADLLMTSKKEAEEHICRILQKARAAGIHMILATQRPSVDVVTGKIKANLNARICFALMTFADSKTVLDQGGADKLLGKGDMLFMSSDTGVHKRIQGCFVTTKEIDDVVTYIKENNADYEFDCKIEQAITNPPKKDAISQVDGDRASKDGFDSLMPQVLKAVIENGHASISMIQRKFLVGFPRAGKIIDQMEQAGFISPSDGSKARTVYITMEEYEKMYANNE